MDVRLQRYGLQRAARVPEADALVVDLEGAADLAVGVEEGHHRALLRAAHVDVAAGGQRRGRPGGRLQAVRQGAVVVAAERVDTGDADGAVGVHGDDRAHLLQHADEVLDLGLDGRVGQLGDALRQHGGQQHLLGGADRRVGQADLAAAQSLRGLQVLAALALLDRRAELAQHLEVEVDRPAADVTAAQAGDEGVAEAVQQRAAQQDRDARGTGVGVDVRDVGALHVRGVEDQLAGLVAGADGHTVQLQQAAHDAHVTDVGDVAQPAGPVSEQRGDHGLRHEILRAADADLSLERGAAVDKQDIVRAGHGSRVPGVGQGARRKGNAIGGPFCRPEGPGSTSCFCHNTLRLWNSRYRLSRGPFRATSGPLPGLFRAPPGLF